MGRLFRLLRGRKETEPPEIPDLMEPEANVQAPLPKQLQKRLDDMQVAYEDRRENQVKPGSKKEGLYQQYRIVGLLMTGHFKPMDVPQDAWGVFASSRSNGLTEDDKTLTENKFAQMGLVDRKLEGYQKAVKDLDVFLKAQKKG